MILSTLLATLSTDYFTKSINSTNITVIFGFILTFFGIIVNNSKVMEIIKLIITEKFKKKEVKIDLNKHFLFKNKSRMQLIINKYDNDLFKVFLNYKVDSILFHTKKLISYKCEGDSCYDALIDNVNSIVKDYENKFIDYCKVNYNIETAKYIICKFNELHKYNIDFILKCIDMVKFSDIFSDRQDILNYYFTICNLAMQNGIIDGEKVFKNFNGDLTKIMNQK